MSKEQTNICKGIAIIMMYVHHLFYSWETVQNYEINWYPLTGDIVIWIAQLCKVCVAVFVFLTGYGSTKSYFNRNEKIKKKVFERYFRFLSNYWIIFLLGIILGCCMGPLGAQHTIGTVYFQEGKFKGIVYFLIDFIGVANIFGTPTFNATWWYVPYAILFIFIVLYLVKVVEKLQILTIGIIVLAPRFLYDVDGRPIFRYLLVLVLGIYFARFNIFEKLKQSPLAKSKIDIIFVTVLSIFLILIRQRLGYYDVSEGGLAICICYYVYRIFTYIKGLNKLLELLGKHSMNLFLLHSFIIVYYFKDEIYSLENIWIILLGSFLVTFLISVIIEWTKKILHFNESINKLQNKMLSFWESKVETQYHKANKVQF